MGMNKSKGNMYPWVTHTWNAIRGTCLHDCEYCYIKHGRQLGWKHEAKLIKHELRTQLGSGRFIFVGSSTDMWGSWIDADDILAVLKHCERFNNQYLFQSKNPERFIAFTEWFPERTTLCTTIETNRRNLVRDVSDAPVPWKRIDAMKEMKSRGFTTTITIEPIMQFDLDLLIRDIKKVGPNWVSIGADSKRSDLIEPFAHEIQELVEELRKIDIAVHMKANLSRVFKPRRKP